jgi:isopenicillin N synthase-like dioxygenase
MQVAPIDLRPFREGTAAQRRQVAERFDVAGRESGFFAVTGHGVDPDLLSAVLEVTTAFFDLPIEDKLELVVADRSMNRGYAAEGTEALAYSLGERDLPPDLFEAFNAGRELTAAQEADAYFATFRDRYFAPNVWPPVPGFRETWLAYWDAIEALAMEIMAAAALALGLPEDHFTPSIDRSISVVRANNYQRRAGAPAAVDGQMRMGAHTDYGSITVLLADQVPGLQLRDDRGTWHDVLPPDGGFLVNVGDLLAEWTNDRWRSTMHRVVPAPPGTDEPFRRRSIAWFQQPNWDAVIECLPTCCDDEHPPRYAPVSSGDHLMAKLMGPRLLRPSEATPAYGA